MKIKPFLTVAILMCNLLCAAGQIDDIDTLRWEKGPMYLDLSNDASVKLGSGYELLRSDFSRQLKEILQAPGVLGDDTKKVFAIRPAGTPWIAFLTYLNEGHINDDESIDEVALLRTLKQNAEGDNAKRAALGWEPLHVIGWWHMPQYDKPTNSLHFGVRYQEDASKRTFVVYKVFLLGRNCSMAVTMMPMRGSDVEHSIGDLERTMLGFQFLQKARYNDFSYTAQAAYLAAITLAGIAYWLWRRKRTQLLMKEHGHRTEGNPKREETKPGSTDQGKTAGLKRHWHEVLGVSASANIEEISAAYKQVIRQYHPDRVATMGPEIRSIAEEKSKEINEAYLTAQQLFGR